MSKRTGERLRWQKTLSLSRPGKEHAPAVRPKMARASYPAATRGMNSWLPTRGSQVPKVTWDRTDPQGDPSLPDSCSSVRLRLKGGRFSTSDSSAVALAGEQSRSDPALALVLRPARVGRTSPCPGPPPTKLLECQQLINLKSADSFSWKNNLSAALSLSLSFTLPQGSVGTPGGSGCGWNSFGERGVRILFFNREGVGS